MNNEGGNDYERKFEQKKAWYIERCVAECVWLRGDKK